MTIDPSILRRILNMRIYIEGPSSWAFREIIDYIVEIIEERLSIVINEVLEPYQLEASVHVDKGCDYFPNDTRCDKIIVVEIFDKESNRRIAYAGYLVGKGENTLIFEPYKLVDAETRQPI